MIKALKQLRAIPIFFASLEIWPVAFCIAASIASERALPLALAVAGAFLLIRSIAYCRLTVRTPADWAVALFLLMLPVTLWATALPDITRPQVYRILTGIALYYAIVNWTTTLQRFRLLLVGNLIAGISLALIAPLSVKWIVDKLTFLPPSLYERFSLLLFDTIHSNVMAGQLVILLPPALGLLLFSWQRLNWLERIVAGMAALFMSSVLLLTQSRGGLMAFGASLLMLIVLRWRRSWLLLPICAVIGAIAVPSVGITAILDVLTSKVTFRGIDGRLELWSRALYMIQDFPFTGIGMGLYTEIADVFYPFFLTTSSAAPHAHNLFLQVAVDLGIPGVVAWLAILMLVVTGAWQLYRHGRVTGDGWVAGIGAGLLCSQVALMTHGLTDAVTWGIVRAAPIVWGLWGLTIAAWQVLVVESVKSSPITDNTSKENHAARVYM